MRTAQVLFHFCSLFELLMFFDIAANHLGYLACRVGNIINLPGGCPGFIKGRSNHFISSISFFMESPCGDARALSRSASSLAWARRGPAGCDPYRHEHFGGAAFLLKTARQGLLVQGT
jgi:hypothetical protein